MGRPKSEKTFANMLRLAIKEAHEEGGTKLRAVAEALVNKALTGDVPAIREIADRLDGKPAQETSLTIEKRDAFDWTRDELVAVIDDPETRGNGIAAPNGRDREPDQVH